MKSVILVAGIGKRLRDTTADPKCLLKIGNLTLLERYLRALERSNIRDVVMVVGYKKERIIGFVNGLDFRGEVKFIENPDFIRGSILSLSSASGELEGDVVLMDGDVYFEPAVLEKLVLAGRGNYIALDTTSSDSGEEVMVGVKDGRILDMQRNLAGNFDVRGEAVGFYRLDDQACAALKEILDEQVRTGNYDTGYEDILPLLFQKVNFYPVVIDGLRWIEIDFEDDVARAEKLGNIAP